MKPTGPIPKKVKCIKATSDHFTVGEEYIVESDGNVIDNHNNPRIVWDNLGALNSKFQPIYTDEELLEYAKKMYPEGTEFYNDKGEYRKSEGVNYLINRYDGCIDVQAFAKDGTRLAPDIYSPATGWVEIIEPSAETSREEKDIDISQINVGDYVRIIDKPADGRKPKGWNPHGEMDYLYGTWQDVLGIGADGDVQIYSSTHSRGVWSVALSSITAVKSYNPNKYISGCVVAIKGGDVTVTDIVDVAPSKLYADHFANSMRAPNFQMLRAMQTQYNMHQHGIQQLIRDSEDHLMFGNKVKEDMLPVPSLRVSRKNIVK
jgi:hypothetical protein